MELLSELTALAQIVMIDVSLAGDNAVVVGMAAAGLPKEERKRAIVIGILAATVLRVVFSIFTVQLLGIIGLLLAGGLLLLWVAWKMFEQLRAEAREAADAAADKMAHLRHHKPDSDVAVSKPPKKRLRDAVLQIVVADVSMSLDNVLAVAGAAREHMWVLVFGLALSVVLMGIASTFIVRLLQRYRWIAYVGLLIILYVALRMIWDGWHDINQNVDLAQLAGSVM